VKAPKSRKPPATKRKRTTDANAVITALGGERDSGASAGKGKPGAKKQRKNASATPALPSSSAAPTTRRAINKQQQQQNSFEDEKRAKFTSLMNALYDYGLMTERSELLNFVVSRK
jgi:DNA-directed RNA polymerase specialized sigma54-like protein